MNNREKTPLLDEMPREATPPAWRQIQRRRNAFVQSKPEPFEKYSSPDSISSSITRSSGPTSTSSSSTSTSSSTRSSPEFVAEDSSTDPLEHHQDDLYALHTDISHIVADNPELANTHPAIILVNRMLKRRNRQRLYETVLKVIGMFVIAAFITMAIPHISKKFMTSPVEEVPTVVEEVPIVMEEVPTVMEEVPTVVHDHVIDNICYLGQGGNCPLNMA